jgi:hypothetical protein
MHSLVGMVFSYFAYEFFSNGSFGLAVAFAGAAFGQLLTPFSRAPVLTFSTPLTQAADHALAHPEAWPIRAGFMIAFLTSVGGFVAHFYLLFR